MTIIFIVISLVLFFLIIAAAIILLEVIEDAPEGYENETGFHEGPEPPVVTPNNHFNSTL